MLGMLFIRLVPHNTLPVITLGSLEDLHSHDIDVFRHVAIAALLDLFQLGRLLAVLGDLFVPLIELFPQEAELLVIRVVDPRNKGLVRVQK